MSTAFAAGFADVLWFEECLTTVHFRICFRRLDAPFDLIWTVVKEYVWRYQNTDVIVFSLSPCSRDDTPLVGTITGGAPFLSRVIR